MPIGFGTLLAARGSRPLLGAFGNQVLLAVLRTLSFFDEKGSGMLPKVCGTLPKGYGTLLEGSRALQYSGPYFEEMFGLLIWL